MLKEGHNQYYYFKLKLGERHFHGDDGSMEWLWDSNNVVVNLRHAIKDRFQILNEKGLRCSSCLHKSERMDKNEKNEVMMAPNEFENWMIVTNFAGKKAWVRRVNTNCTQPLTFHHCQLSDQIFQFPTIFLFLFIPLTCPNAIIYLHFFTSYKY